MSAFDNYALMERELPPRASALKTTKPQEKMTSNPAAATGLLATIEVAFLSGAYSDLVIQCHGRVFKAHKLIVCGQSEWFAKAVQKDGFQVSDETSGIKGTNRVSSVDVMPRNLQTLFGHEAYETVMSIH